LFDARRPQGVPYAGSDVWKKETGGVALPATYRKMAQPLNIVGAIELEASPWVEDNLWVLEQMQTDTLYVGTVGDLEPEKPDFRELFDRFRKNPMFLGIRCGLIWGRDVTKQADDPKFIDGLKRVADADLVMDTANPNLALLRTMVKLNDKIPNLRIMCDHMMHYLPKPEERAAYTAVLKEIKGRPNIWGKLSDMENRDIPARGLAQVKDRLDVLMDCFGEDRVVFGTKLGPKPGAWRHRSQIVTLARAYFATRSRAEAEEVFLEELVALLQVEEAGEKSAVFIITTTCHGPALRAGPSILPLARWMAGSSPAMTCAAISAAALSADRACGFVAGEQLGGIVVVDRAGDDHIAALFPIGRRSPPYAWR
jgi:predicted TIM-barrel fold metal-dependent hydrolase